MARPRAAKGQAAADTGAAQVVERTLNQIRPGIEEKEARRPRFNQAYDVWRGNAQGGPVRNDWQSRLRVKYGMQVIDQALVNLVQGVPKAKVTPRRPEDETKAKPMENLLGYYADLDHLAENEPLVCQQALIYGLSPAKTCWWYREEDQTQYLPSIDPESGMTSWAPKKGTVITADRPSMEPWDAYAIGWDPAARNVDTSSYVFLQSWKTKDELEQARYDDDSRTGQYRNLDLLYASGDGTKPPTTAQNQMFQQPEGLYRGRFEILEVWRKTAQGMRLTVIGNRKILLKDGQGPYWMSGYPVTISNSRPDLFRIEGVSESELVDHLQQAMWTVHNLRMEQLKFTVLRGATVRQGVPDLASLVMRPNFRWIVQDHDDVKFQEPPPLPAEAYKETDTLLSLLQYVTGITPYVGGASGSGTGVDQTTATGVSLLTESASRLLQFKAGIIHQRTWQRTFEQWGALTKQFLRRPMAVRVEGAGGQIVWQNLGPGDVNGDFDIRIQAGDESASRQQERADAAALLNAVFPYVQLGVADPKIPLEKLAQAFNLPNADGLLKALTAPPQAAPNNAPPQLGAMPPPQLLGTGLSGAQPMGFHPAGSVMQGHQ